MVHWANAYWLLLIIPWILLMVLRVLWIKKQLRLTLTYQPEHRTRVLPYLVWLPELLIFLSLLLMVLALGRPQQIVGYQSMSEEGIEIMLVLDVSKSMEADDFLPSRLAIAKQELLSFIEQRSTDRIGLVVFAEDAFSACPLTLDNELLKEIIHEVSIDYLPSSGTAVGTALVTAINRLENTSSNAAKVILLLTDGVNNKGRINPITSAELAKKKNITIYCIGIGTKSGNETEYDFPTLQKISQITGGKAFEAQNPHRLSAIFQELDLAPKSIFPQKKPAKTRDMYPYLLLTAFLLILLAFSLKNLGVDNLFAE